MQDDRAAQQRPETIPRGEALVMRGHLGQRASTSADEAWAMELARIRAMTPRERMLEALELDEETEELLSALGRARP